MERLRRARRTGCEVAVVALLALLLPAGAEAKLPAEAGSEPPPGVTVTGIGFGPSQVDAVDRAVGDARRRGAAIARVLRLELGAVEKVELPELTQFGEPRRRRPGPTVAAATVTFAIVGGATAVEGRSVEAHGAASARVQPRNRSRSRSIKRAALATRRTLAPQAAAAAGRNARTAAAAAELGLGAVVSVEEATAPYYYGVGFYDAALGSFGPGRFCGIVLRPVVRRDPETGEEKVVRRVPHRRCFVPNPYSVRFSILYLAG